jgi:uncharacterized protein with NRDE domain
MCTLIVLHRCVPDRPLVVAANRDEFLDRPAEEPALRSCRTGPIVAPLDLEAGGTWVGLSARGVFAGLTNLRPASDSGRSERSERPEGPLDRQSDLASIERASIERKNAAKPELRSRGDVVMMALEAESAVDAIRTLSNLEVRRYNPFQLLVADGHEAWLVVYRESSRIVQLEPGPHIVGNVVADQAEAAIEAAQPTVASAGREPSADKEPSAGREPSADREPSAGEEPRARKLTRIRERVEKMLTEPGRDHFEGLARICREHVEDGNEGGQEEQSPFESTCVHVADRYGTRSSLLLELSTDPSANRLWTTDGPPCERPFENRSFLLRELGVRLSNRAGTETT